MPARPFTYAPDLTVLLFRTRFLPETPVDRGINGVSSGGGVQVCNT